MDHGVVVALLLLLFAVDLWRLHVLYRVERLITDAADNYAAMMRLFGELVAVLRRLFRQPPEGDQQ